jgi:hypothetical protein
VNVVAVLTVPAFTARLPTQVKTRAAPAATLSLEWIVIVIELVDVVDAVIAVLIAPPASVPVHVGVIPLSQMALCAPPAVNMIVPLLPIAVAVVAVRTIFDGVRSIEVSSTTPSIEVIAVTELNVAAPLGVASVLEMAVAVNAVIVVGLAASSLEVLQIKTIAA